MDMISGSRALVIAYLILTIHSLPSFCQVDALPSEYIVERLTTEDGLSSDAATCYLKDRHGFMWIGTTRGLNRYDGYSFKSYFHQEDSTSLADDFIVCLCEDKNGMIWVGTMYGGLHNYNPSLDEFSHYPVSGKDPYQLKNTQISAVCVDLSGDIWFAAHHPDNQSIHRIDPLTDSIHCIAYDPEKPNQPAFIHSHAMFLDSEDNIWVGFQEGLLTYDRANHTLLEYKLEPYNHNEATNEILCIFEDRDGILWTGTYGGGLYQFNRETNRFLRHYHESFHPDSLSSGHITAITEDNQGVLIVRTVSGIDFLNKKTGNLRSWINPYMSDRFEWYPLTSLFWDRSGILWFSIPQGKNTPAGIYKLTRRREGFTHFDTEQLQIDNPETNWISSIAHDDEDNVWIGGYPMGLVKINSLGEFHYEKYEVGGAVSALYLDRSGKLWKGGWVGGLLHCFDFQGETTVYTCYQPNQPFWGKNPYQPGCLFGMPEDYNFSGAGSMRIHEDSKGHLWIARGTGLELLDPSTGLFYFTEISSDSYEKHALPVITSIAEDRSGNIWIGTMMEGLFMLEPPFDLDTSGRVSASRIVSYRANKDTPEELKNQMITSLCIPRINTEIQIWLGTMGAGIFGLSKTGSEESAGNILIEHYTTDDGLCNNVVFGILEDENGNLWISTENGLSRFAPGMQKFQSFDEQGGLPVQHFHWLSSHEGQTGHLFFGGNNGVLMFHPDSLTFNLQAPPVVITSLNIMNQPVSPGDDSPLMTSITETSEIELTYRDNYLGFEFAALDFVNPGKNQYKYKLEGLDRDWIKAGTFRAASYSNLRHGKYIFRVIGSNNDGVWNEVGDSLAITIHPPPWLRWWAYLCYFLLLAGIILLIWRYLVNRAKMKATLLEERIEIEKAHELDQMKSRFFANISHEFRTPLTLLLGPIEDKLKSRQKLDHDDRGIFRIMHRNAKRLQRLINQLLDLSKLEFGKARLQASEGDISGFSRSLAQSFLSLAESRNIVYRIHIPKHPVQAYFDPDILEKILINLISNAFKFTPEKGSVSISMHLRQDKTTNKQTHTEFTIKDTGKGIPPEQVEKIFERFYQVSSSDSREFEGTGIGLALCRELANMHHGNIKVKSAPGKGSTFTVVLPCSREYFTEDELAAGKVTIPEFDEYISDDESDEFVESSSDKSIIQEDAPVLMIVEDNADLRRYITQNLEDQFQICEAVNGRDGLNKTIEIIPDLVITDLMMPVMDGIEMCSKLKDDDRTSHIPVIIITAKADRESKIEGLETGADDYLIKPFDAEELQIRVRNMIEHKNKIREQLYKEFIFGESGIEIKGADKRFLQQTTDHIQNHIGDPEFNVQNLVSHMGISQMQLYRKLRGSANMTPGELIRITRLKSSLILLKQGHENISQIAYQVGFSDHSHYSKCFRELYGMSPKEYTKGRKKDTSERTAD